MDVNASFTLTSGYLVFFMHCGKSSRSHLQSAPVALSVSTAKLFRTSKLHWTSAYRPCLIAPQVLPCCPLAASVPSSQSTSPCSSLRTRARQASAGTCLGAQSSLTCLCASGPRCCCWLCGCDSSMHAPSSVCVLHNAGMLLLSVTRRAPITRPASTRC